MTGCEITGWGWVLIVATLLNAVLTGFAIGVKVGEH